jgi:tryptophan halogenase
MTPIRHILIVGGGTAGWLSATFLARTLGPGIAITLVESPEIGVIGVGEGSFPSLRGTLAAIGVREADFMRECQATFKQGIRFDHWVRPPGAAGHDHYFHPFSLPSQRPGGPELLPYWLQGAAGAQTAFADAVTMQKRVVDACRAPKRLGDADFQGPMNYAYHFDAMRLAAFLAEHAQKLGVRRRLATVQRAELDEQGAIARVHTAELGALDADLYIDCTGFRALLIGQALGVPAKPLNEVLFVDRALALQVPYAREDSPIASCTISTAQEAGWTWDIGLQQRRGIGYVYSSHHTSDERAEAVLRAHIGPAADGLSARRLPLPVGYREVQWRHNCVAVGLSSGFIEPLEASGVGLIEMAAYLIGFLFPFDGNLAPAAGQFNSMMRQRYERIVDFVKMHYCLSQRRDSAFWADNCEAASIPATLQARLAAWRGRPPHRLDFITDIEMYPPSSWQYVYYGMEAATDLGAARQALTRETEARQEFQMLRQISQRAVDDLPDHREFIGRFCGRAAAAQP